MADIFASAAQDNQDIGYWNVNSVTNMSYVLLWHQFQPGHQ